VIEAAITGLTYEEQMEVVKIMSKHLVNQDVISPKVCATSLLTPSQTDCYRYWNFFQSKW
jgi:hypothetical protein